MCVGINLNTHHLITRSPAQIYINLKLSKMFVKIVSFFSWVITTSMDIEHNYILIYRIVYMQEKQLYKVFKTLSS